MKKTFFLIAILSAMHSFAQKENKNILTKGQKVTVTSSSNSDTDMGMGMKMKNTSSTTNILTVISDDAKNYTISNTVTKINVSMDLMEQHTSYDSEKPEDKDSEAGKEMSQKLNVADTVLVDKISGTIVDNKKNKSPERPEKGSDDNPLGGLINSIGNDNANAAVETAFFINAKNRKTGESWTDSSTEKNMKSVKTYTIKSIEKNIATIAISGTMSGDGEGDMEGSTITYSVSSKNTGEMLVDIKNGLVNKVTNDADMMITVEVMGQTMPMTSKANSTITYQY